MILTLVVYCNLYEKITFYSKVGRYFIHTLIFFLLAILKEDHFLTIIKVCSLVIITHTNTDKVEVDIFHFDFFIWVFLINGYHSAMGWSGQYDFNLVNHPSTKKWIFSNSEKNVPRWDLNPGPQPWIQNIHKLKTAQQWSRILIRKNF